MKTGSMNDPYQPLERLRCLTRAAECTKYVIPAWRITLRKRRRADYQGLGAEFGSCADISPAQRRAAKYRLKV
jgi:hypothetical protein